jgi:hypothetical protein
VGWPKIMVAWKEWSPSVGKTARWFGDPLFWGPGYGAQESRTGTPVGEGVYPEEDAAALRAKSGGCRQA